MKHMIFERADGSISIGGPNTKIIAAMMGDGGLLISPRESISLPHQAYIESYTGNRFVNLPKAHQSCRNCPQRIDDTYDMSLCCSDSTTNTAAQAIVDRGGLTELDFEVSKSVIIDGIPEVIARECFEGKAFGGLTEDEARRRLMARHAENVRLTVAPVVSTHICEHTDLPGNYDKTLFRRAWCCRDGVVEVDMPKARGIHMDRIRVVRNAELATRDITFMRAVEAGDTSAQATIGAEKQTLRDIPQTFDLTTDTPEELKALWPTELM